MQSIVDVAVHEAGHAVFAIVGGLTVKHATVRKDSSSDGHVLTVTPSCWGLWNGVVMSVAGCAAGATGRTHRARLDHGAELLSEQVGGDLTVAARLAAVWLHSRSMPTKDADRVVIAALGTAIGLLQRKAWQAAVQRVAGALLTHGTVSGRRCAALGSVRVRAPEAMAIDAVEYALGVR